MKRFDELYYYQSFSTAANHTVMIYNNEINKIAMAVVIGNLCKEYNLDFGPDYRVVFYKK